MVAVSALPCSYSRAWSPSDDPTLFAWFDADSFSARDGGTAAKWVNKEGTTARDMIGGSDATTDPQLCGSSDFLNGRAGVEFDQDTSELDVLQTSGTVVDLDDQPYTVCLVVKDSNQVDIDYFLLFFEGGNVASFFTGELAFGGNVYLYGQSGGFNFSPPQSYSHALTSDEKTALAAGATLTTVADGSNYTPFFNGVAVDLGTSLQQDSTTNAASMVVGALQTFGTDATLYELVICIGTGSNDNAKAIEGYLAHRYGRTLPDTHKYKKGQPWGLGIK